MLSDEQKFQRGLELIAETSKLAEMPETEEHGIGKWMESMTEDDFASLVYIIGAMESLVPVMKRAITLGSMSRYNPDGLQIGPQRPLSPLDLATVAMALAQSSAETQGKFGVGDIDPQYGAADFEGREGFACWTRERQRVTMLVLGQGALLTVNRSPEPDLQPLSPVPAT